MKQIRKNHKKLDVEYAKYLAVLFEKVAKQYNVKPEKVIAIARQESAYKLDAVNCYKKKGKIRCDYCMMQINDKTIKSYGFDQKRLMTEEKYCIEAGVKVLADFKRMYGKKETDYWSRYNSSNPEKRQIYHQHVARWF